MFEWAVKAKRPLDVEYCRSLFPDECWEWAFFENAGGSFVPRSVIERMAAYMTECQVQPGAPFPSATLAAERMSAGHKSMADFIGADVNEVVIGPSTSANIDVLSRSLRPLWAEGDEVIVATLNHEANSGAWRRLDHTGIKVVEWPLNPDTVGLDIELLNSLLSDRTKLVAVPHVSNITGDINDIQTITKTAHAAGALVCIDGVAFAPHRAVDVKAWDVDFYCFSLYKTFGPHVGLMYGKRDLLLEAKSQHHYFIPETDTSYKMNPAGPQHEMIASLQGIADYFESVANKTLSEPAGDLFGRVKDLYGYFERHEEKLAEIFLDWVSTKNNVRLLGRSTSAAADRAPTFSIAVEGSLSEDICRNVESDKIAIRHGDFYARRLVESAGISNPDDGVIRCSMAHYNTEDEVKRLVGALDRVT